MSYTPPASAIAIVGMSCRFPGARTPDEFWRNLINGVESITRFSDAELIAAGIPAAWVQRTDYVKASPVLDDDPGLFDASFFGYTAQEATTMDPQQRVLLELAHSALEDAACDPRSFKGRIGVFVSSAMNTYFGNSGLQDRFAEDYIPTLIVNDKDFLATRISYKLGLRGPSMAIQTACSSSLVGAHLGCQSLLSGEIDVALIGAVSIRVPHRAGYFHDGGGVLSTDGRVRAFDANANGTIFGSGGGAIILKRLADALAEGDPIYAVIRGSAVNNDGSEKAGYSAPSVDGQAEVVIEALANADVEADDITCLEAHGSGTPVGDPIEVRALTKAFRSFTTRKGFCALGSVKTNVGHLDVAAGMAGLIKTALALKHRQIPPTLHFSRANPEIDFTATPFFVATEAREWTQPAGPLRAGVMATGMGGTNAYVVLEEAPLVPPVKRAGPRLLVLSAKSAPALQEICRSLSNTLAHDGVALADAAFTLQRGRQPFAHRRYLVCNKTGDAVQALNSDDPRRTFVTDTSRRQAAFLFPGVGDHYVGMGEGLYERFVVFRDAVDQCAEILQPHIGTDVRALLYPRDRVRPQQATSGIDLKKMLGRAEDIDDPHARRLEETRYCHPALFTMEYALAQLWISWGVQPTQLIGHSMGEYVAACLAGVFSLEDALKVIAVRARLANSLPRAAMLAVILSEKELLPLLRPDIHLALINGPSLCVAAGTTDSITAFAERLKESSVVFRPVRNSHAFHTPMMDPITDEFHAVLRGARLNPPRLPFVSNVSGDWITAAQAADPAYWVEHCRSTARFSEALHQMWKQPDTVALEAGPGRTLGVLAMQHPARLASGNSLTLSSLRHGYENQPDAEYILNSLGRVWSAGMDVNWDSVEPEANHRKISLPTYPFARLRYWIEPTGKRRPSGNAEPSAGRKSDLADWFYVPSWERSVFPATGINSFGKDRHWLIVSDSTELATSVQNMLREDGATVETVSARANQDDFLNLFASLKKRVNQSLNILHLGCISATSPAVSQDLGFFSLMNIAKAIGEHDLSVPIRLGVVTSQIHGVTGEENLNPDMATILGPCGVIPKEYPNIASFSVDIGALPESRPDLSKCARNLLAEFANPVPGEVIAHRGRHRWLRVFKPHRMEGLEPENETIVPESLRHRGVYLITGGVGGIGLTIAKHLAKRCAARLALTRRSPLPPKTEWHARLNAGTLSEADAQIIRSLLEIESLGGEVDVFACDVSDRNSMHRVVNSILAKHETIHGVIHAAGIVRDGMIQMKTRESAASVLSAKVDGTMVLFNALKDVRLDFLALCSSTVSVLSIFGQADYGAANSFLDAFAQYANAAGIRTVAINWSAWLETGMHAKLQATRGLESWLEFVMKNALSTEDGIRCFERALICNVPQIVVSPRDINVLLKEMAARTLGLPVPSATRRSLDMASENGTQLRSEPERTVADIWENVLGITPIGLHDNFFDLGGHSLQAMQIATRIRTTYNIPFGLRQFTDRPTIAEMDQFIRQSLTDYAESHPALAEAVPADSKPEAAAQRPERAECTECAIPLADFGARLSAIWQRVLQVPSVGLHDNFFELGGNPTLAAKVVRQINQEFRASLTLLSLLEHPTVEGLGNAIYNEPVSSGTQRLTQLPSQGSDYAVFFIGKPPLEILYHECLRKQSHSLYLTNEAPSFLDAMRAAAEYRYESLPSIEQMAAQQVDLIRASGVRGPYVLAGFSAHGLLAFEVGRQLCAQGLPVERVILLDSDIKAPEWARFRRYAQLTMDHGLNYLWGKARKYLQYKEHVREQASAARLHSSEPDLRNPDSNFEQFKLPIWLQAFKRYKRRTIASRGVLIRARESVLPIERNYDGCFGWSRLFTKGLKIIEVSGDHFSMWLNPHVSSLAEAWNAALPSASKSEARTAPLFDLTQDPNVTAAATSPTSLR